MFKSPNSNLQQNMKTLINAGHIVPHGNEQNPTIIAAVSNRKEKNFFVDSEGKVFDPITGKTFYLRQ